MSVNRDKSTKQISYTWYDCLHMTLNTSQLLKALYVDVLFVIILESLSELLPCVKLYGIFTQNNISVMLNI